MSTGSSTRTALRARREQRRVRRGATLGMCCGAARRGPPSRALRPRRAAKRGAPRAALSAGTPTAHVGVSVWGLRRCISAPPVGPGGDGEQNGPFRGGGEGGEGEPRGGRGLRVAPPYGAAPPPGVGRPSGGLRPGPARPGAAPSPLICSWNRDLKRCGEGRKGGGARGEAVRGGRSGAEGGGRRCAETPSIEVGERCGGGTGRGGCGWGGAGGTWGRWGSGAGGGVGRGTRVGAGMAALCAPEPPPPRPQRGAAIRGDGAEGAQWGGGLIGGSRWRCPVRH